METMLRACETSISIRIRGFVCINVYIPAKFREASHAYRNPYGRALCTHGGRR